MKLMIYLGRKWFKLEYRKTIQLSKEEVDEAVKEYVSLRENYKAENIYYITDHNGELTKVVIDVK